MKSFEELYDELYDKLDHYIYVMSVRRLTNDEHDGLHKVESTIRRMERMMANENYDTLQLVR